ncbi:TonB-dependent siderophore receptor [Marinobacter nanhaiticus D15-8W]|uniref:TonB-dependent siderophore receptor n=1 Tax=Marinobacter nanhaiticus D15-8W TaxID=626887 RepID=N6WYZ5_9GAMM|nr:TonB-dependent siderophore receptor [Marinobacter nanhaiticus]ENO16761.1 TonB-dependent siderophore receptor [Marinobacter nanhaiticus D15-8W]BES72569.1 TonB-dependent siderophore receptor [Marinobacter nanhaiticus D15-8W]
MNQMDKRLTTFRRSLLAAMVAAAPAYTVAQDNNADTTELDEITVTADKENPLGPDEGYKAERSLTATKTDTPLSETPRSVSVVTREQIEDQGAQTLSDILDYVPGISTANYPAGDALAGDIFYIRGMNQRDYGYGTYRDGLRMQPNAYSTSAEPYGLERVEVFKGPTSVLYGENVPGGLVNLVSKRPTDEPQAEVNLSYGTHDRKQVSTDVSGALVDDGSVRGRLVFLGRQSDTQTDSVPDDRVYIAPSISIDLTDRDTLTLLTQYQKDETEIQLGLPAAGTLLDHPNGQLDTDTNLGHPDWDTFDREFWSLGYEYEHLFNEEWAFRQNARYVRSLVDRQETWWTFPPPLPVVPGLLPNGAAGDGYDDFVLAYGRDRHNDSKVFSIDNQIVGNINSGRFENTVLVGASFDKVSFEQTQYIGQPPNTTTLALNDYQIIGIFDPQWMAEPQTFVLASKDELKQDLAGGYAQLQTKVGGLIALVGGRYDWAKSEINDRSPANNDSDRSDSEFTWQTGLMYQFDFGLSPYVSYATTFVPVQQISNDAGDTFEPITGDQIEVGVKYEPIGWNTSITVAAYDLTKEDDVVYDERETVEDYRQVGETESRGVEVEVKSDITESFNLTVSYSYTDAEITEDWPGSRFEDEQITGVPRHQASLWANYRFMGGALNGLQAGLGARYLGSSYAYPPKDLAYGKLKTDDETLIDAALAYALTDNWSARVNVKNLFDKEYIAQCNNAGRCYYGSERTVQGTVSYNW